MNNAQAKNGFKTFIITLSISLVAFSALYYFITDASPEISIEDDNVEVSAVDVVNKEDSSVFETIAMESKTVPAGSPQAAVLAGTDVVDPVETTQSTTPVPNTGSTQITMGLLASFIILSLGTYLIKLGPRNLALASFEKRVKRDLE